MLLSDEMLLPPEVRGAGNETGAWWVSMLVGCVIEAMLRFSESRFVSLLEPAAAWANGIL